MKLFLALYLICSFTHGAERIISTSPSITEMLGYFKEDKSVVAVSSYCQKPKKLCAREKIGTMITMDLEKVVSLKPTVVFTLELSNKSALSQLKKLGINTIELSFNSLNDVLESFKTMGKFLGKDEIAKNFENEVRSELEKFPHFFKPEHFAMIISTDHAHGKIASVSLAGLNTYFNDIVSYRGHLNIAESGGSYPVMDRENLLARNPERIWVISPKRNKDLEKLWKKTTGLTAVKNKNISFLSGDWAVVPGPELLTLIKKIRESY